MTVFELIILVVIAYIAIIIASCDEIDIRIIMDGKTIISYQKNKDNDDENREE